MSDGTWRKRRPVQGTKHSWPETTPPCRTSEPQRCTRCGLERHARLSTNSRLHVTPWVWTYTRVMPNPINPKMLVAIQTTEPGKCEAR